MPKPKREEVHNKVTSLLLVVSFLLGAVIGTTGDFVHVITATDGYPKNGPFPFLPLPVVMPVWVPFLFGTGVMMMAIFHKTFARTYYPKEGDNRDFAIAGPVLFLILYALTGFIQVGFIWQDVWIAAVFIGIWFVMDRTFMGIVMAFMVAAAGTAFEIFLVHMNGFFYYPQHSGLLGVPTWLPWLYASASVCISLFVRMIKK